MLTITQWGFWNADLEYGPVATQVTTCHHDLCEWISFKVWLKLFTLDFEVPWIGFWRVRRVSVKVSYVSTSPVLHCFQLPVHQRLDAHLCFLGSIVGRFLLSCFVGYLENQMFTQWPFHLLPDEDSFLHVDSSLSRATDWSTLQKNIPARDPKQ